MFEKKPLGFCAKHTALKADRIQKTNVYGAFRRLDDELTAINQCLKTHFPEELGKGPISTTVIRLLEAYKNTQVTRTLEGSIEANGFLTLCSKIGIKNKLLEEAQSSDFNSVIAIMGIVAAGYELASRYLEWEAEQRSAIPENNEDFIIAGYELASKVMQWEAKQIKLRAAKSNK